MHARRSSSRGVAGLFSVLYQSTSDISRCCSVHQNKGICPHPDSGPVPSILLSVAHMNDRMRTRACCRPNRAHPISGPSPGAYGKFTASARNSTRERTQTTISRIAAIVQLIARVRARLGAVRAHKSRAPVDRARRQCHRRHRRRCWRGIGGENTMAQRPSPIALALAFTRRVITPEFVSDTFGLEVACWRAPGT